MLSQVTSSGQIYLQLQITDISQQIEAPGESTQPIIEEADQEPTQDLTVDDSEDESIDLSSSNISEPAESTNQQPVPEPEDRGREVRNRGQLSLHNRIMRLRLTAMKLFGRNVEVEQAEPVAARALTATRSHVRSREG